MDLTEIYPWSWGKIDNVVIEGDNIVADVNAKIDKYYPFNCEHINQENVFTDFISIRMGDNNSICNFIKQYGFLYFDISESKMMINEKGEEEPYCELLSQFNNQLLACKQISDLYTLICKDDYDDDKIKTNIASLDPTLFLSIQSKIVRALVIQDILLDIDVKPEMKVEYLARSIIASEVNKQIKTTQNKLIVDMKNLAFEDSWQSPNLLAMIYLMFSLKLVSKKVLRKCKNPYCENSFFLVKNDKRKDFCTHKCAAQKCTYEYKKNNREKINAQKRENRKKEKGKL
jgi:hypothetical protein